MSKEGGGSMRRIDTRKEERRLINALKKDDLDDGIRAYYEKRLDWVRRGAPKEEAISDDVQERSQFTADGIMPARYTHLRHLSSDYKE